MRFRHSATVGLALWATLGAPNLFVEEAEADHPAVAIAAIGASAFVTTVGIGAIVVIHAIDNDVSAKGSVDVEGVGSAEIEVGGGGNGEGGGDGGGPQQSSLPGAWIDLPGDLPFGLPPAYQVQEQFGFALLPGQGVRFQSDLVWDADVLTPGHLPTVVDYDVKRLGEATFTRPPGSGPGQKVVVDLQVDIDQLHVSTSPVPQTHGYAGFAYRVTSPQLGVLFQAGGSVHQGQAPTFFGQIPPAKYQPGVGEFLLPAFHETLAIEVPGNFPVVDLEWELVTFGTGVKEQGAPLHLSWSGGLIGESLTFDLTGDPNEFVYLVTSLSQGQLPLGLFDGLDPRWLSVGPQFAPLSGPQVLDGAGQASVTHPVPDVPGLVGLELFAQAVSAPGQNTFFDALSAPVTVVLADQGSQYASQGPGRLERRFHASTVLADGRVLVTGGLRPNGVAERTIAAFDPEGLVIDEDVQATIPPDQSFVVAELLEPRLGHHGFLLPSGDILIFGGTRPDGTPLATTELVHVNPDGTLEVQPAAPLPSPRHLAGATLLDDGSVIVSGGAQDVVPGDDAATFATATDEVLRYADGVWMSVASLPSPRLGHGQSLLGDGTVMLTGGIVPLPGGLFAATDETLVLDPATNALFPSTPLMDARALHTQVPNGNGGAFIAGGGAIVPSQSVQGAYELSPTAVTYQYDPTGAAGYAAAGLKQGANVPNSLIGVTLCCFCYGAEDGYFVNWCCCMPCIGPVGDGPIIIDPKGAGTSSQPADVALFESGRQTAGLIAQTLFDRAGATLTELPAKEGAVLLGGGSAAQPAELLITGDASGL